jgi:hypothetical protein
MEIKVLGPGCPKCKTLEKLTREAVAELGINRAELEPVKTAEVGNIFNFGTTKSISSCQGVQA